jgi:hypothetical protein
MGVLNFQVALSVFFQKLDLFKELRKYILLPFPQNESKEQSVGVPKSFYGSSVNSTHFSKRAAHSFPSPAKIEIRIKIKAH